MSNTTVFPLSPLNNHRNSAPVNLGGYDCNFIEDPPDELVCQICTLVAQHPYQSTCCGRVYCKRCIEEYRRKQEELTGDRKFNCPNCRRRANTFHDKRGSRNIKCLKVKCTNLEFGCEWEGELLNLDNHVSTKCPHSRVQCPNRCSMVVSRGDLESHQKGTCPLRHYSCPDCGKSGTHHYITAEHQRRCPEAVVPCPNGCGFVPITRRLEANHCKVCPNKVVSCEYSDVGCREKMKRKEVALHCAQRLEHHLHLALEVIRNLQRPVTTFKMKDYSSIKSGKKWWYSAPFYSHAGGYKLCLGVMPSGNGDGKGTHVSVYVYRMKGENDDLLEWPFRGQVTFELLNQAADSDHITRTVPFDFQVANEYNSQVVKGERSGQGWGFNRLVSHDHLVTSLSNFPQGPEGPAVGGNAGGQITFLKDDCLFFRVVNIKVFASNKPWLICSS